MRLRSPIAWLRFKLLRAKLSMDDSAARAALRSVGFENSATPVKRRGRAWLSAKEQYDEANLDSGGILQWERVVGKLKNLAKKQCGLAADVLCSSLFLNQTDESLVSAIEKRLSLPPKVLPR